MPQAYLYVACQFLPTNGKFLGVMHNWLEADTADLET